MFQNVYGIGRGKVDVIIQKKKATSTGVIPPTGSGLHEPHNKKNNMSKIFWNILNHLQETDKFTISSTTLQCHINV